MARVWLLPVVLAACAGTDDGGSEATPDLGARMAAQTEMTDRVDALFHTAWSAMPTTGTATYTGFAEVVVPPGSTTGPLIDGLTLLGDLSLTADFGAGTMTGEISDIQGHTGATPTAANSFDATGSIAVGGDGGRSQIGNEFADPPGSLLPNSWMASYGGTLETPLGEMDLNGQLMGQFEGTLVSPQEGASVIPALSGSGEFASVVLDGEIATGSITVVAEN